MNINNDNYEIYFLDYFEGKLSPGEIEELLIFLKQHPEVKSEFEGFELVSLIPDNKIHFERKELLLRSETLTDEPITSENIDEFLIAEMEGFHSDNGAKKLNEFISSNPGFEKDRHIFSLTRLRPNSAIKFPDKQTLMHLAIPLGNINESNYEEYLVGELESSLSSLEKNELDQFLTLNPHLEKERKQYGFTKLKPDDSIKFEEKASLKRSVISLRRRVLYTLSAAASIVLLLGFYLAWQNRIEPASLADNKPKNLFKSFNNNSLPVESKVKTLQPYHQVLASNVTNARIKSNREKPSDNKSISAVSQPESIPRNTDIMHSLTAIACKNVISHDYVEPEFMFIRTSQMHSNEYMELYYNVKLAEQIQYAQLNETDSNPERTIINSFASRISNLFTLNSKNQHENKTNLSVWTFAELGVKTYNSIAQDNVKLDLVRNEQGKVVAYNLVGDKLDLQRDVK